MKQDPLLGLDRISRVHSHQCDSEFLCDCHQPRLNKGVAVEEDHCSSPSIGRSTNEFFITFLATGPTDKLDARWCFSRKVCRQHCIDEELHLLPSTDELVADRNGVRDRDALEFWVRGHDRLIPASVIERR